MSMKDSFTGETKVRLGEVRLGYFRLGLHEASSGPEVLHHEHERFFYR
jgi:hypothetical protein